MKYCKITKRNIMCTITCINVIFSTFILSQSSIIPNVTYMYTILKGTTALDNIYEVAHHVGITTIGIGTDQAEEATRVFCRVLNWNGLQNTVGYSTVGQGHSTRYLGDFSWGRLQLNDRQIAQAYTANINDGVTGIKTGPQVKRKIALKSQNYVV